MLLNDMSRKKEVSVDFTFEYEVDAEQKLEKLFWCDNVSKRNYKMCV